MAEKVAYFLLALVAVCWILDVVIGMIVAFPFGLIGLVAITALGILLVKVFRDRLASGVGERCVRGIGVFSSYTNFCSCQASWQGTHNWSINH